MADVTITHKGKPYDFYLGKNDKGQKLWSVEDARYLPTMITSDRPLNAQVPPLKEDLIDQDDFYAGAGEILFEHGKRVYNSPNTDTRVSGRVRLAPQVAKATITKPATVNLHAVRNWGFEANAFTAWTTTQANASWSVVTATPGPADGTYCAKLLDSGAGSGVGTCYQNLENYANLKGKSITVTASSYCSGGADDANISIADGAGTETSSNNTGVGWETLTVTKTIDAAATQIRITLHAIDTDVNGYVAFDKVQITIAGTALVCVPVVSWEDFDGYPYCACGYYLGKWDGTDIDLIAAFTTPITHLATWGAYLFIALGTSTFYWYCTAPGTATTYLGSLITDGKMQFLSDVASTLWGNDSTYQVKSSTNPLNGGSWSAATDVVGSNKVITALIDHPDTVVVCQEDGFYEITATAETPLVPDLYRASHSKTGRSLCYWKGNFYLASGFGALYEYDYADSVITTITPKYTFPTQGDFDGFAMAMDGDDEYLYVCIDNGVEVEILAGRWETIVDIDGTSLTDFWWHHLEEFTLTATSDNVRSSRFSTLPSARALWLGCAHATDGIYYLDPDTNLEVAGDLLTPWHTGTYKHILKQWYSITVRTTNCSATKTIAVSFKKEWDSTFTSLGTISSDNDNTLYFSDVEEVITKKLQIKFTFASDSTTVSPEVNGYTLRCMARPFDLDEGRITLDDHLNFRAFGGMETSWAHPEFRDVEKNFYSMSVMSEGLAKGSKYITIQYKVDDDATWNPTTLIAEISPYQTIMFPENTQGKMLYLKFTLSSPSDTNMVAYILDGILRPPKQKSLTFALSLASLQPQERSQPARQNVDTLAQVLREIDNESWPVELKGPNGVTYKVTFENVSEEMTIDPPNKEREYLFTIKATEALI